MHVDDIMGAGSEEMCEHLLEALKKGQPTNNMREWGIYLVHVQGVLSSVVRSWVHYSTVDIYPGCVSRTVAEYFNVITTYATLASPGTN